MKDKNKKIWGKVLRGTLRIGSGIIGGINPVLGMVTGGLSKAADKAAALKEDNLKSEVGGVGKADVPHAIGALVGSAGAIGVVGLIVIGIGAGIAVGTGFLTMDQVMQLIGFISENVPVEPTN